MVVSSGSFKVVGLGVDHGVIAAGQNLQVVWSDNVDAQTDDWYALFRGGTSNSDYIGDVHFTGTTNPSGHGAIRIPPDLPPNNYEIRLFMGKTTARLALSPRFYVTAADGSLGYGSLTNVQATYVGEVYPGWAPGGRLVFDYSNSLYAEAPCVASLYVRGDSTQLAVSGTLALPNASGTIDLPNNLNVLQNYELRLETGAQATPLAWSDPFWLGHNANLGLSSVTLRRVWDYLRNSDSPPSRQDVYFTTSRPNVQDMIVLRHRGTDWSGVIDTYPTRGQRSGMAPFYISTGYAPGVYEAAFIDGLVNQIANVTNPFTVTGA